MRIVLVLVLSTVFLSCTTRFFRSWAEEEERRTLGAAPEVTVYQPDLLSNTRSVAVPDFRVMHVGQHEDLDIYKGSALQGRSYFMSNQAGMLLAESFEEEILKSGIFDVAERNQLKHILQEKSLQETGIVSQEYQDALSKAMGVDAVLLGTFANAMFYLADDPLVPMMFSAGIRARLIDLKSGKIILTVRDRIFRQGIINEEDVLYLSAERFTKALGAVRSGLPSRETPAKILQN